MEQNDHTLGRRVVVNVDGRLVSVSGIQNNALRLFGKPTTQFLAQLAAGQCGLHIARPQPQRRFEIRVVCHVGPNLAERGRKSPD